jgi:hypothetical protein
LVDAVTGKVAVVPDVEALAECGERKVRDLRRGAGERSETA